MFRNPHAPLAFAAFLIGVLLAPMGFAAGEAVIQYRFEEPGGVDVKDSGALGANGRLNPAPRTPVLDAYFEPAEWDRWYPILRAGVQIKDIREKSESFNSGGDVPIMMTRNADYDIDCAKGRVKALAAGRIEPGTIPVAMLTYTNPGAARCDGRQGRALLFDGHDDMVDCGAPAGMDRLASFSIDLWFQRAAKGGAEPMLITKGNGLALGFDGEGRVVLRHHGLKGADGRPIALTRSVDPVRLTPNHWHRLAASYDGTRAVILLNGRAVAETTGLAGIISAEGSLRLGGVVDPHFFGGKLDEVTLRFTGPAVRQ